MDKQKTGELIKSARIKKGYTQVELGDLLGVTNKAISRWEKGDSFPDIGVIEELSRILDIRIQDIVIGEIKEKNTDSETAVTEVVRVAKLQDRVKKRELITGIVAVIIVGYMLMCGWYSFRGHIDSSGMYYLGISLAVILVVVFLKERLIGADMQLENADGEIIDEWISDGTNHIVTELPAGDYTLKEIAAPDGYVIATDIEFEVFADGTIKIRNVDSTAISEDGNPLIVMVDDTTKVKISKRDITTDKELPGATLQIIDEDGNVVEEWVSADEAHLVEGKLIAGKEYTLREIIAPDGYEIANEIKFTVNEDGSVTEVVMYDELTPVTNTPYTGDNHSNFAAFAMLGAASVILAALIITKKGKRHE